MIRIIGVGSPFGDDAAGLEAGRALADSPPPGCEVRVEDRPGASLVDLVSGVEAAIVLDAVASDAAPGTLHDLPLEDAGRFHAALVSSHDLGVGAALALARALGRMPRRGRFLGVEGAPGTAREGAGMSPAVRAAIPALVARAREWAARLASGADQKTSTPS
jgi:hydrogenase maturation protease